MYQYLILSNLIFSSRKRTLCFHVIIKRSINIIKSGLLVLSIIVLLKPVTSFAQADDSISINKNEELGEVEIIGQRTPAVYSQMARKVTVITREDIMSSSASTIQDLLEYTSSVDIRQRNVHGVQADIQLRGGTFDEVMILINGINITDSQTGHFNLDIPVELSSVERIEILHGSGARIYGANAYKGIINIITKKNSNQLTGGINYGQHNLFHSNASAGFVYGKLYNGVTFSHNSSDGFTENTDYKINHIYYQGEINNQSVNIFWQAGLNRKAFGANDFYSPSFPEQYEETASRFGSLELRTKGKIKISGLFYLRSHQDHFLLKRNIPSFYENYHVTYNYGIRVNASFTSNLGKSSVGIEDRNENILSTVLGENLSSPVKVERTDSTYYLKGYSRNTLSYFMEQNYTVNNLYITGGFLLNLNKDFNNKFEIFPGIDLSYSLFDNNAKVFASLNRSLRLPTFTDMFYKDPSNEGNSELNPEELMAFETGIEYTSNNKSTGVTFFRDQGKHVIDWIWLSDRQIYKAMNISEVTTRGFELSGKYHFQNDRYRLFSINDLGTSYTYIDLEKSTGKYESKYSLDYLKHKLQLFVTCNIIKKINVNWQVSYISRNGSYIDYDTLTNTLFISPFKPYWLVDTKISYTIRHINLFVVATNLFNTKYIDIGNLIQPGRWIITGVQFDFFHDKKI
jgi:vitamin B12 transporter